MAKTVLKKRKAKERVAVAPRSHAAPPPWRVLLPEIIYIIIELLKDDKATLRACSLAAREFSQLALSRLGRHITISNVHRVKLCAHLLTTNSAFQHVRSLDIAATGKYLSHELTILQIFSQRHTLTRLWLTKAHFPMIGSHQTIKIQDVVIALSSTVNDLGLYECLFPSYADMISFIRAFPHCDSLCIRNCVAGAKDSSGDVFSGLPGHKLSLNTLELSFSSSDRLIIDVSSLIEDADLDDSLP